MADVNDEIRREAMGYESKEDTARRMGGHGIPTAGIYVGERTAKRWKIIKVWAVLCWLIGIAVYFVTGLGETVASKTVAFSIVGLGLVLYVISAVGAWWHHG
jgi:hypothetical protein